MNSLTLRFRNRVIRLVGILLLGLVRAWSQPSLQPWEAQLFGELCGKYAQDCDGRAGAGSELTQQLDTLAASLGERLAKSGTAGVPAEDIASLALLLSRLTNSGRAGGTPAPAQPARTNTSAGNRPASEERAQQDENNAPRGAESQRAAASPTARTRDQESDEAFADVGKGQEGFVQGVDRLAESPLSERMVITGDITSGFQAATVTASPDLTSTFGRARVNFVTRAVPASADGKFREGYFFLQIRAAGGPFDASAVGGPSSFSPLNDVATDRSRFNEGTSRGNLYLAKAFYQQEVRLGEDYILARVGIVNLADFFDTNEFANNEARQFLGSAFVNSAGFKSGISAPGFMGEYHRKAQRDWLNGIVFRAGYAVSRTERAFTSPIWVGETELSTILRGRQGKYRFGGTIGNVSQAGGVRGFHLGFDQWLSQDFGAYGRYAWSNSGPGSISLGPVKQSYSGGVQWRFVDERDRTSAWAFGFSQSFGIETTGPLASERALETYYRWQLSDNFALTPDFQLVFGSGGSRAQGTHVVAGMRMNFGF